MQLSQKEEIFERYSIPKAVMTLSVPTMLSSLVMVLYSLADTYFVGLLNDPVQSSAVTLAAPVLLAFNAVNNLFGVGGSSMMSRALGRKDYDTLRRSSSFSFYGALIFGVLFAVLCTVFRTPLLAMLGADASTSLPTSQYLNWTVTWGAVPAILNVVMAYLIRSEGSAMHASIGTMSGCFLNIILDPIFVLPWGLGMGAAGAALATFLSNTAALVYFLAYLLINRRTTCVCISPKAFCLRKNIVLGVFGVGVPASIQNLLNVTGMTILNNFTSAYKAEAIAAMGIAQKVNMLPMYVALGLSQGVMPLISYNYSSGNIKRMKDAVRFAGVACGLIITMVSAAYFIAPGFFVRLFMDNESIIEYGSHFLRGMSIAGPFMCMDFLAVGVFQAVGFGCDALIFAIFRKIILEIPALWVLNRLFPLYGLAYAQPFAEAVLSVVAFFTLARIFKKAERENVM